MLKAKLWRPRGWVIFGTTVTMMGNMTAWPWGRQPPPLGWMDKQTLSIPPVCPPIPSHPAQHWHNAAGSSQSHPVPLGLRPAHVTAGAVGGAGDEGGGVPCQRHGCGAGAWQQLLAAPLFSWPWCSCLSPPSLPSALGESAQCWPCSQHSYLAAAGGSARGAQCRVPVSPPLQSCLMGVGTVPGPSTAVACADPQPRAHL